MRPTQCQWHLAFNARTSQNLEVRARDAVPGALTPEKQNDHHVLTMVIRHDDDEDEERAIADNLPPEAVVLLTPIASDLALKECVADDYAMDEIESQLLACLDIEEGEPTAATSPETPSPNKAVDALVNAMQCAIHRYIYIYIYIIRECGLSPPYFLYCNLHGLH